MDFLKKFFDDDSMRIGLCKFNMVKQKYSVNSIEKSFSFNSFQAEKIFKTNFENNFLLF